MREAAYLATKRVLDGALAAILLAFYMPVALAKRLSGRGAGHWPVLWSILAGRLSFVGPRVVDEEEPLAIEESERRAVRPGLFCYWWLQQRANIDFGTEA